MKAQHIDAKPYVTAFNWTGNTFTPLALILNNRHKQVYPECTHTFRRPCRTIVSNISTAPFFAFYVSDIPNVPVRIFVVDVATVNANSTIDLHRLKLHAHVLPQLWPATNLNIVKHNTSWRTKVCLYAVPFFGDTTTISFTNTVDPSL